MSMTVMSLYNGGLSLLTYRVVGVVWCGVCVGTGTIVTPPAPLTSAIVNNILTPECCQSLSLSLSLSLSSDSWFIPAL